MELNTLQRGANLSALLRAVFSRSAFRQHVARLAAKTERGQALFYESSQLYRRRWLTGGLDLELARRMANRWHQSASGSRAEVTEGAGHCVNLDDPAAFNALVLAFIDGTDRGRLE